MSEPQDEQQTPPVAIGEPRAGESSVQPAAELRQLKDWVAQEYSIALRQKRDANEMRSYALARIHCTYAKAMSKVLGQIEQLQQDSNTD